MNVLKSVVSFEFIHNHALVI